MQVTTAKSRTSTPTLPPALRAIDDYIKRENALKAQIAGARSVHEMLRLFGELRAVEHERRQLGKTDAQSRPTTGASA